MATRKKKPSAKAAKKKKSSSPKPTRKQAAPKKAAPGKKAPIKTTKPAIRKTAAAAAPKPPAAPAGMERVGVVTHYYSQLSVAIISLGNGGLREGDDIRIKGHTSDFTQPVESMEIDHARVTEVRPGQSFGLRVQEHAREHDVIYKTRSP